METCPHHHDPKNCEAGARALLTKLDERAAATESIESVVWEALDRRLRRKWGASFLEENDPCDCWKQGGLPMPSLARSALVFHWRLPGGKTPAEYASDADLHACPVLMEFFAAQKEARLSFFRITEETKKDLHLIDEANGALVRVDNPFSKGWMQPGYVIFGRVFRFRGKDFLGESEGMPVANRVADEAVRKLRKLAAQDPERASKLFQIFFENELTGLETEAIEGEPPLEDDEEEPFLLRKGGNVRN